MLKLHRPAYRAGTKPVKLGTITANYALELVNLPRDKQDEILRLTIENDVEASLYPESTYI